MRPGSELEVDEPVATPEGTPLWLQAGLDTVYGVLHGPQDGGRPVAVLIVGPFGWEDLSSYRARREWARALAGRGFIALRIDLPGTGDSPGASGAPESVARWTPAIAAVAQRLRDAGAQRVAAIGIGLGGLLCVQALADGAGFDDLILWGAGARGRAAVRELRAYAGIVAAGIGDAGHAAPAATEVLDLAGFALSREAAAVLERIDLTTLALDGERPGRALLIGRAGPVDQRLRDHLGQAGIALTVDAGDDYDALMAPPQAAAVPTATIARSIEWLSDAAASRDAIGAPLHTMPEIVSTSIVLDAGNGASIRETLVGYDAPGGRVVAIVSEPADTAATGVAARPPLCVVLPNAGSIRRSGPNRMWTELARHAAATGLAAVRVDVPGIGDAAGDAAALISDAAHYAPGRISAELELLDRLERAGVADRFVPVGLCSSSYWGWQAALRDERVIGAALINLYAFDYSPELVLERDRRRAAQAIRSGLLERLRRKGLPRSEMRRALVALGSAARSSAAAALRPGRPRDGGPGGSIEDRQRRKIADAFALLARRGTRVVFLFSERELLLEQLERQGQLDALATWPNLEVERLASRDHEMRILAIQRQAMGRIERLLAELAEPLSETGADR